MQKLSKLLPPSPSQIWLSLSRRGVNQFTLTVRVVLDGIQRQGEQIALAAVLFLTDSAVASENPR